MGQRKFFIRRNDDSRPATYDVLRRRRVTVLHVHSRDGRRVEDREPVVMRSITLSGSRLSLLLSSGTVWSITLSGSRLSLLAENAVGVRLSSITLSGSRLSLLEGVQASGNPGVDHSEWIATLASG